MCDQYSNDHDLIYNISKKTMCMYFTPKSCKSYECKLSLNQESLSYVWEALYLVHSCQHGLKKMRDDLLIRPLRWLSPDIYHINILRYPNEVDVRLGRSAKPK